MTTTSVEDIRSIVPTRGLHDIHGAHQHAIKVFDELTRISEPKEHYRIEQLLSEFLIMMPRLRPFLVSPLKRYLDVGCGSGESLLFWSGLAQESLGIDREPAIEAAKKFLRRLPAPLTQRVSFHAALGELVDLTGAGGFDLITTQYVLEHVDSVEQTLLNLRRHVSPRGIVVHTVPGSVGRASWYMEYRTRRSPLYRLAHSVKWAGIWQTLKNPFAFTPAHEPGLGNFDRELGEYRLDRWALHIFRAGFVLLDYFQTEDTNWVLVTEPRD